MRENGGNAWVGLTGLVSLRYLRQAMSDARGGAKQVPVRRDEANREAA